ncbi:hypothetical protein [Halostella litorea]|uniref:hypothetical protein n=1 Tax=Halostella litorea TaxID=2528831 RepID=UPI0010925DFE|nr:hypothetical protein [Halostella litorea]
MVDATPTEGANRSSDVTGSSGGLSRRRYLALTGVVTVGTAAGCISGSGGGDGNGATSGGAGNADSGPDPFSSVEADNQRITATMAQDKTADAVKVVDPSGQDRMEVEVTRGSAEIPVSTVGDCGSCEEFTVHLPGGEYELVAIRIPEDDAERPTEVGRRPVTVERSAEITAVDIADGEVAVTVRNTGQFLIRARALRYEPTDPATTAASEFYSRKQLRKRIGIERTDTPDHELRKTESRPVLEHIVVPGSTGTFTMGSTRLYRSEELTEETACTGQSVDFRFEFLGQSEDMRAAATGTMRFNGGVETADDESFACKESRIDNVSSVETQETS